MGNKDDQYKRIDAIVGPDAMEDFPNAVSRFFEYLKSQLPLPCEVTGGEDFNWEEPYVFGGWDEKEYEKLKKTRPSYKDRYQLLAIEHGVSSDWMICAGEDLAAHVQRTRDGKKFVLGLSELEVPDEKSPTFQLIKDYAVFFWNYRC